MKRNLTGLALALACGLLGATETEQSNLSLVVHGVSYHSGGIPAVPAAAGQPATTNVESACGFNPGLGLRYELAYGFSAQGGVYKNSECNVSGYAILNWLPLQLGPVGLGVFAGGVTGYRSNPNGMLAGGLAINADATDRIGFTVRYVPKHPYTTQECTGCVLSTWGTSSVLSLELLYRF